MDTGRTNTVLVTVLLVSSLGATACGRGVMDLPPYPRCESYPCDRERLWWDELFEEEKRIAGQPADGRVHTLAEQLIWKNIRRMGRQAAQFDQSCRRHGCSGLQVARHLQRVVYPVEYYQRAGIPLPERRGPPRAIFVVMEQWTEPWLLLGLLLVGLLAALTRWGLLGAYALAAMWHRTCRGVADFLGSVGPLRPGPMRWPVIWGGLYLAAGWIVLVLWKGWGAIWNLFTGGQG